VQPASVWDGDHHAAALLVGLAAHDPDSEAVRHALEVGDHERHQLRPAQRRGHVEGEQRPVADGGQRVAADGAQHRMQDVAVGGRLSRRRRAVAAADAGEHVQDDRAALCPVRRDEARQPVVVTDGGQDAPDRGRRQGPVGQGRKIDGDGARVRRQRGMTALAAPGGESPPVRSVLGPGAGGARRVAVAAGAVHLGRRRPEAASPPEREPGQPSNRHLPCPSPAATSTFAADRCTPASGLPRLPFRPRITSGKQSFRYLIPKTVVDRAADASLGPATSDRLRTDPARHRLRSPAIAKACSSRRPSPLALVS